MDYRNSTAARLMQLVGSLISSKRRNGIFVAAGTGWVPLGGGGARTESWLPDGDFSRTR